MNMSGFLKNRKQYKAEFLLLMATVIWGGTFAVTKSGLDDASPLMLLGIRCSVATVLFLAIFFNRIKKNIRGALKPGLLLGMMMFLGLGLQNIGLQYTTASRSGFLTFIYALFVPFLQVYFMKKRPQTGSIIGLIIVMGGLFLLTDPGKGGIRLGDILTLGCAIVYAFYIIFLDTKTRDNDVFTLTFMQFGVAAILSLLVAPLVETPFVKVTTNFIWAIAYLAILGTMLCTYVMTRYQKDTTPMRAVLIYAMEPIVAAVLAVIILKESLSPLECVGAGLIFSGVVVSECWGVIVAKKDKKE
jgi:drug/metabolite transporter (DMT)-like permease